MKKIDQTVFTVPGGNCFSACVAMLLGLELADVPYFMGDFDDGDLWWDRFREWLRPRGFWPLNLRCPPGGWTPEGAYVLSGGSPRGDFDHSVVAVAGSIFHDPHPSRDGLVRSEGWQATLLIPFEYP